MDNNNSYRLPGVVQIQHGVQQSRVVPSRHRADLVVSKACSFFFIEQTPANNSVFTLLYVIISVNIVNIVLLVNWHCIGIYIHYGVACVSP